MLRDLTMPFSPRTVPVPGHPEPSFEPLHVFERDGVRNTIACFSIHTGTHVDAPSHFIEDGRSIDQVELDRFARPGLRLDLGGARPGEPIALADLERAGFDPAGARGTILVLASGWADVAYREPRLYRENPFLAADAAEALAEAGPSALALDFPVDSASPWPNHTTLLGAEVLLIENLLNLRGLPAAGFEVLALPLRLEGENGAPARVVARLPGD
jgi:kynurenine formamidase